MKMFRGDHETVNLRFTKDGVKQNITGWSIYFTAKRKLTDTDPQAIFQKNTTSGSGVTITDAANGLAEVAVVPVDTSGLEDTEVSLICDVQAKDASSQVATTGYVNLVVQPDVSRDLYVNRVKLIAGSDLLQYIPLWEATGPTAIDQSINGRNGTYSGAGVLLGQKGIGDGRTAMFTSGSGNFCNLYSTSLRDAFDWHEFTAFGWIKFAAGAQTDGVLREALRVATTGTVDYFYFRKDAANNSVRFVTSLNGTIKSIASSFSSSDWFFMTMTQSKSADQFKAYINASQFGNTATGLGTKSANNMADAFIAAFSSGVGFSSFHGNTAHFGLIKRALTLAEIRVLASP